MTYMLENKHLWDHRSIKPVAFGEMYEGYSIHEDNKPFKEIRYPYTERRTAYLDPKHKNSFALDGAS